MAGAIALLHHWPQHLVARLTAEHALGFVEQLRSMARTRAFHIAIRGRCLRLASVQYFCTHQRGRQTTKRTANAYRIPINHTKASRTIT